MSKRIQSVVDEPDYDYLEKHADKEGFSISTLVRWILLGWITTNKEKEKREREQKRREAEEGRSYGP